MYADQRGRARIHFALEKHDEFFFTGKRAITCDHEVAPLGRHFGQGHPLYGEFPVWIEADLVSRLTQRTSSCWFTLTKYRVKPWRWTSRPFAQACLIQVIDSKAIAGRWITR